MSVAARLVALALASCTGCAAPAGRGPVAPPAAGPRSPARVVLVSVSGLAAHHYRGDAPAMPNLAAWAAEGVAADAVEPVAPASRYPAHATLATGLLPRDHGIVADRRLGEHGVRSAAYDHASLLRGAALWQVAGAAGLRVASLGWPTTVGAEIALSLPDLEPGPRGAWLAALADAASPELLALAREAGGEAPATRAPGPARDAVLAGVGCALLAGAQPPQLLLLALSGPRAELRALGPDAPGVRAAFAAADGQLARLVGCVRSSGRLASTAFVVVGDHGTLPAHSALAPNAVLAAAGLLTLGPAGTDLLSWKAIARSNGGSAFVYASGERDAVLARRALADAADETRAFRIVSAEEMLALGADPDAWFGLEAQPGYLFSDLASGPPVRAAGVLGGWGYLPGQPAMQPGFVAWGAGWGRGVRVPEMRQTDVAPTLAHLLGLSLDAASGRALEGVLRLPHVSLGARE